MLVATPATTTEDTEIHTVSETAQLQNRNETTVNSAEGPPTYESLFQDKAGTLRFID